ncbi:MAG: hypothetical protein IJU44_10265 [Kiritimatiellae bacterium]|nr:hypothetical protein [Kiritimatiellia bacterium]
MENKTEMFESDEARGMRESIEEMENELAELDRDIAEAEKGKKGELSRIALKNFLEMRRHTVDMIEDFKELYIVMLESEALQKRLEGGE